MSPASQAVQFDNPAAELAGREENIAPAPRVSVQAFCETVETAAAIQAAGEDRRLAKAHLRVQMGGLTAAIEAYQSSPTQRHYSGIESRGNDILDGLDQLAPVCDAATRVIIIGRMNDVTLYRELVRRGVSDYLIAPVNTLQVVRAVCGLFSAPDAKPVGRIIAVVGAKGGVGSSTIAHNIGFSIARDLMLDAVVTDLDLAFGTAGLDFNQDPPQGIAEAVFSPDRIDHAFIDRLLSKCTDHLSLLAAPATLDRVYDFGADAFDQSSIRCARRSCSWSSMCRINGPVGPSKRWSPPTIYSSSLRPIWRTSKIRRKSLRFLEGGAAKRSEAAVLPQPGRGSEATGNKGGRFRQSARRKPHRLHSVRAASIRRGCK